MSDSKEFYKFLIATLIQAKVSGDPNYESKLDTLVSKMDAELSQATRLRTIEQDISAVNDRMHFIDKKITAAAEDLYTGIQRKALRKRLVIAYESMGMFAKNQNIKSACKYLIVQAELLCNHLSHEAKLVDWVIKNTPSNINVSSSTSGGSYLSTWNLLKATDRRFSMQFNENAFYDIKQLRDYESHGYHEGVAASMEVLLNKVSNNWSKYQEEGLRFIDRLITEQYNYP